MARKQELLAWSGVSRSNFYYKRGDGVRNPKPSKTTVTQKGECVEEPDEMLLRYFAS